MQLLLVQQANERLLAILNHILFSEFAYIDRVQLGLSCDLERVRWWTGGHQDPARAFLALTALLHKTQIPDIALRVGDKAQLTDIGMLGYAMLTSPSIEHAIRIACHALSEARYAVRADLSVEPDIALVTFTTSATDPVHARLLLDANILSAWRYLQAILPGGRDATPEYLTVTGPEPEREYSQSYRRHFGNAVSFAAPSDSIAIRRDWLRERIPTGNSQLLIECSTHMHQILRAQQQDSSIIGKVKTALLEQPQACNFCLEGTAAVLNINPHSLRRYIQRSGTNFRRILTDVRMELALQYLSTTPLSPKQIAYQLGYTEPNNFIRAFKSHYGLPPQRFRASAQSENR